MYTQFSPGNSIIHRASTEVKLTALCVFAALSFAAGGLIGASVYLCAALCLIFLARLPFSRVMGRMKSALIPLAAGCLFNLFFSPWRDTLALFLRLSAVITAAQVFAMTTPLESIAETAEKKLKLPRDYTVSLMIAVAFLPILRQSYHELREGQIARGCEPTDPRGLIPVIIPVFRFALRKAEILGEALFIKGFE